MGVTDVPGNASTSQLAGHAPTEVVMENRDQVREFLTSRRERISPARAGLPAYGGANRRVKGLRREEVALLAGVSIHCYVRMERGNLAGSSTPSPTRQRPARQAAHRADRRAIYPEQGIPDPVGRRNVHLHRTGHKRIHHPVVGTLELDFEATEFPAHPGLTLLAYTAAAGTPTADGLKMLASWAATAEQTGNLPAGV
jgi:hypothetical protein